MQKIYYVIEYLVTSHMCKMEFEVDVHGIRRRKADAAEKYKKRVFVCKLCGWAYSNKYAPKVKEHSKECPSMFIFNNWQPQKLEALKFMKS